MFKLSELLNRTKLKSSEGAVDTASSTNAVSAIRSWYEERYETLIVQRNMLMIAVCVGVVIVVASILAVAKIATSKAFDPFVIQIEQQTGATKVVNPLNSEILDGNEALARYFIKHYISARETYNPVDYLSLARKTVRLLSTPNVFRSYLGYIRDPNNDLATLYGEKNTTYLTVKSWSKLDKMKYVVRFSISETAGHMALLNKIAIVDIAYVPMQLKDDERDINPVGFQVTGYRVDNDNS